MTERKCIKCIHFPCLKVNCSAENTEVCDLYETEVSRAIKKLREEGYIEFERSKIGGNMNKFQKELIEKCKEVSHFEDTPLFDDIYVLPTTRKHDSGYKILYVIGQTRKDDTYYLLDTYCDVVDFGEFNSMIKDLHIDVLNNGIIHYWSNYQQFKSIFRVSNCTFEMINKTKLLWEK